MTPAPVRRFDVDGRGIWVFDGLLPDAAAYEQALGQAAFTRTEVARPETAGHRHWVTETRVEALLRQPLWAATEAGLRAAWPDRRYAPYRSYTNVATFGDMLFTHVDCMPGQDDVTALWYMCAEWDIEWGGETVFFDHAGEIAASVRPRPGRLVLFDGTILHVGRPPNRVCWRPRYTYAIKLSPASSP